MFRATVVALSRCGAPFPAMSAVGILSIVLGAERLPRSLRSLALPRQPPLRSGYLAFGFVLAMPGHRTHRIDWTARSALRSSTQAMGASGAETKEGRFGTSGRTRGSQSPSTIFIVSMLTVTTRWINSTMYRGSSCSSHQSFGSLTIPDALSVLTW